MKTQKILLVINTPAYSRTAVRVAKRMLAEGSANSIVVMSVVAEPEAVETGGLISSEQLQEAAQTSRENEIKQLIEQEQLSITGPIVIRRGQAVAEITQAAQEMQCDLVVKAAVGKHTPLKRILFGSTSLGLMRKCHCPVWIVRSEEEERPISKIVAAVAVQPQVDVQHELDKQVINAAAMVAKRHSADLYILHSWELAFEKVLRGNRLGEKEEEVDRLCSEVEKSVRRSLDKLVQESEKCGVSPQLSVLKGDPTDTIPGFVADNKIDLLVMGTVGRSGLAGLLMSNKVESVLYQVECSVLALRPDSPMQ